MQTESVKIREIPVVPRELKKKNLSPKRLTNQNFKCEILNYLLLEKLKCIPPSLFHVKATNDLKGVLVPILCMI